MQFPKLGQGTWFLGEEPTNASAETRALRLGVELGMSLIDTAEMYGDGKTEEFLGKAMTGLRDKLCLVSKVYPHNASRRGVVEACHRSLKRLATDRIDVYLLHWPGSHPLCETVAGFEELVQSGKIRHWGVSNFDVAEMRQLPASGCVTNQILYNPTRRGAEFDLLPYLEEKKIATMAYSPVEQGRLPVNGALAAVGRRHGVTPFQVALAWVLRLPNLCAIPKAATERHIRENRAALDLSLTIEDLEAIDAELPPPTRKIRLQML